MSAATSIVLIGMMGSGKSSLAPLLAAELGIDWADLDASIENAAGKSVERIFAEDGQDRFRELESAMLVQVLSRPGAVVAVGGGAPLMACNRKLLAAPGCTCVYLQVAPELLAQRLGDGKGRPLLKGAAAEQIERLIDERSPIYEKLADLTVRVNKPEEEERETCRRILDALA